MRNLTKSILSASLIILAITGCSTNPPLKSNPTIPKVTEIRSLSDRNAIALEWNVVNNPEIKGYYIQKSEDAKEYKNVAKIEDRYVSHWTDIDLKPNKIYYYKISTFDKNGIPSFAKLIKTNTYNTISPVSFVAESSLKVKGMIKIIFRPHQNERVKGYIIERFNDKNGEWEELDNLEPRLRAEYIDKDLIDGKVYRYRIIAYTFDGLKSKPSKEVAIQTLQKPQIIVDIRATTNLPKKIVLNWKEVPNAVKYKIYSSDSEGGNYTLLSEISSNNFIDSISSDGERKFYKISSVSKDGVESLQSQSVMGSSLEIPSEPIVSIEKNDKSIKFIISSPDKRGIKYLIKKDDGKKIIKIHNVKDIYIDKNIKSKNRYNYEIYSIDKNNLISNPAKLEVTF